MAYSPAVQPRGDQYLFQGISQLGEGVGQAVAGFRRNKKESEFLDKQMVGLAAAMQPMIQSGEIDPKLVEDMEKFPGMSLAQKRGTAASMLFQFTEAKEQTRARKEDEDRALRNSMNHGRLVMEAARMNEASQDRARERQGTEDFNRNLADYMQTPEMIRRPSREALPEIAARAGVATPDMVYRMEDARLRDQELGIRDRAVTVQERNAGVAEGKLDQAGVQTTKPEAIHRQITQLTLKAGSYLTSPAEKKILVDRIKVLNQMLPEDQQVDVDAMGEAEEPAAGKGTDAKQFTKGMVVRQNGKQYQYDGQKWLEVK